MIVVVTGASAGVGRATALEFARQGIDVVLLARNAARLEAATEEVRGQGVRALPIVADVADADAVEAAANRIETEFGPIDIWVNNAMATIFAPIDSQSRRVSSRYRSYLSWAGLWNDVGTLAHA